MVEQSHAAPECETESNPELVRLLYRRGEFLDCLVRGTAGKPELSDELDLSRSTVDRAIRELQVENLVEKQPNGYVLTTYGEMIVDLCRKFKRDLATIRRSRESLISLPSSAEVDLTFFTEGSVVSATDGGKPRPGEVLRELLGNAEEFWAVTRSPHFELISLAHRRVVQEDMEFNLIHAVDTVDRLQLHYPDIVESALASGNLTLYSLENPPPFGMMKASRPEGDTVVLVFYDGRSEAKMLLINETVGAVARFDEVFQEHREQSTRIVIDE